MELIQLVGSWELNAERLFANGLFQGGEMTSSPAISLSLAALPT